MTQDPAWILAATTVASLLGNIAQATVAFRKGKAEASQIEAQVLETRAKAEFQFLDEALALRREMKEDSDRLREETRQEAERLVAENKRLSRENDDLRARVVKLEGKIERMEDERVALTEQINLLIAEIHLWRYAVDGGGSPTRPASEGGRGLGGH